MQGMIFAAGLGTRLRPLTDNAPKAMVKLLGTPLIEYVINKMSEHGIAKIVINTHHKAEQIEEFVKSYDNIVISNEKEQLLDTGGAVLNARDLFTPGEDILIHNVDIYTNLNLGRLIKYHESNNNYATLVVRESVEGRCLRFNNRGVLKGWENSVTNEKKIVDEDFYYSKRYSYCGIMILSSAFINNILLQGKFSIIDELLLQAAKNPIKMFKYDDFFVDLGTPEAILNTENILKEKKEKINNIDF